MKIINKILYFIKDFFNKNKRLEEGTSDHILQSKKISQNLTFQDKLKTDTNKYSNISSIIDDIDKSPDLIYTLSYSRLVQLNHLYEERIKELELELKLHMQN